jgi:alpha-D-ribose 1-methylphosphonate 5-triphosphate synthase subunit PhnG
MAILDAAAEADPVAAGHVEQLCGRVAGQLRHAEAEEWAELAPTIVEFEELR